MRILVLEDSIKMAALLRKTLRWGIDPRKLRCPELTPGLRKAYGIAYHDAMRRGH